MRAPAPLTRITSRISKRAWIVIGAGLVAVVGAGVWVFGFILPGQQPAEAETITQTATASLETLEQSVEASGTLAPASTTELSFEAAGTVTTVSAAAGDIVAAGQTLATIDTLQLDAQLLSAQADLAQAQADLAELEDADDDSTASEAKIAAAEAAVEVAQAAVDEADAARSDATLTAPIAGLVTSVGIEVGDVTSASGGSGSSSSSSGSPSTGSSGTGTSSSSATTTATTAFTIVSTDSWTVDVTVGEADADLIAAGNQVELATDDGDSFFGTVSEVGVLPSTTSGTAAYPVTIAVTGSPEGLYDGISVTAQIIYERRSEVLTVPAAAVTTADGTSTVTLVADDGSQTETVVEVGETADSLTEILSGLSEGDEVLVASFTPGEGNAGQGGEQTGQFPSDGTFPSGDFSGGEGGFPSDGQFPGGASGGQAPGGR